MKKLAVFLIVSAFSSMIFAKDVNVKGYYKSNGTYVAPHTRTSSNATTRDNWSTVGNQNPHTGKAGTKANHKPYGSTTTKSTKNN